MRSEVPLCRCGQPRKRNGTVLSHEYAYDRPYRPEMTKRQMAEETVTVNM